MKQSTVVHLRIYPKELITYFHTKACTRIFIETSFISVNTWKQSRCPSGREWISKHPNNGILVNVKKRSAVKSHPGGILNASCWKKEVNLQRLGSVRSQPSGKGKTMETMKGSELAKGWEGGRMERWTTGDFRVGRHFCMRLWGWTHANT